MNSRLALQDFTCDLLKLFERADRKLMDIWCNLSDLPSTESFNNYELSELLMNLEFITKIKGDYININKLNFILFGLNHLSSDLKDLSALLDYRGFELLIKELLIKNNFHATNNFRFTDKSTMKSKTKQKKYEIDVIGMNRNHMLIIDAKQWKKKDSFSAMNSAADHQLQRARALKENPDAFHLLMRKLLKSRSFNQKYLPLVLIPIMVTFEENHYNLNLNYVPLIPISKLNAFLLEFQNHLEYFSTVKIRKVSIQKKLF